MTGRLSAALFAWFASMAVALSLSWLRASEEAPSYSSYGYVAPSVAQDPIEASHIADASECRALFGPNAAADYLPDGQHRCTDKHGRRLRALGTIEYPPEAQP